MFCERKKRASDLHHTATTIYPCCVPTLGDSTGAGCVGLAQCKYNRFERLSNYFKFLIYLNNFVQILLLMKVLLAAFSFLFFLTCNTDIGKDFSIKIHPKSKKFTQRDTLKFNLTNNKGHVLDSVTFALDGKICLLYTSPSPRD